MGAYNIKKDRLIIRGCARATGVSGCGSGRQAHLGMEIKIGDQASIAADLGFLYNMSVIISYMICCDRKALLSTVFGGNSRSTIALH